MYLILENQYAEFRNWKAAKDDGCTDENLYKWNAIPVSETQTALHIDNMERDGHLLTEAEKAQLVETIEIE